MSDIEEDVKRCKELIKPEHANWIGMSNQSAISNVLAEREQDKKRIQELEKENEELLEVKISCSAVNIIDNLQKENKSKQKAYDDCYCEYKNYKQFESIPKQVVKDKIEELENAKRETTRENWYYIYSIQLKILEELLEESK